MKKRFDEIVAQANEARGQLSQDHPQYQKHLRKLDGIIWATSYVRRLLLIAFIFFALFGIAFQYLMYPDFLMMLILLGVAVGGGVFCWAAGVLQLKLYGRSIRKIRST